MENVFFSASELFTSRENKSAQCLCQRCSLVSHSETCSTFAPSPGRRAPGRRREDEIICSDAVGGSPWQLRRWAELTLKVPLTHFLSASYPRRRLQARWIFHEDDR